MGLAAVAGKGAYIAARVALRQCGADARRGRAWGAVGRVGVAPIPARALPPDTAQARPARKVTGRAYRSHAPATPDSILFRLPRFA
ncbi:unnamed protein product, partial [Iphiclides podalirius]